MRRYRNSLLIGLAAFVALFGCVTPSETHRNRAELDALLGQWKTAMLACDESAVLKCYAPDMVYMTKDRGRDALVKDLREELFKYIREYEGRINLQDATIVLNNDRATVIPVSVSMRNGTNTFALRLKKLNGQWLITEMTAK